MKDATAARVLVSVRAVSGAVSGLRRLYQQLRDGGATVAVVTVGAFSTWTQIMTLTFELVNNWNKECCNSRSKKLK